MGGGGEGRRGRGVGGKERNSWKCFYFCIIFYFLDRRLKGGADREICARIL